MLVLAHASLTFQNAQAFTWLINVTFPKVPLPDSCLQGSCYPPPDLAWPWPWPGTNKPSLVCV